MDWQPIVTAPKADYVSILMLVELPDGGLDHRIGMWDPENSSWTVFMANWDPEPIWWMPLPALPQTA